MKYDIVICSTAHQLHYLSCSPKLLLIKLSTFVLCLALCLNNNCYISNNANNNSANLLRRCQLCPARSISIYAHNESVS